MYTHKHYVNTVPVLQVEVIINKIPSSCTNDNCSFIFTIDKIPTVWSVSPSVGEAGTIITITGTDFHESTIGNVVTIGTTICSIIEANETFITCTAGPNAAGMHSIVVTVDSRGSSSSNATFQYTLSLDGLGNSFRGSIGGGTLITILGIGFPTVPKQNISYTSNEFAIHYLNESGVHLVQYVVSNFTISLNGSVCTVVESNYSYVTCITSPHSAALVDITVKVSDNVAILYDAYKYSAEFTPIITEITPTKLSVHSINTITIAGSGFASISSGSGTRSGSGMGSGSSIGNGSGMNYTMEISVIINGTNCIVENWSDTVIVCIAPPQKPNSYIVFVAIEEIGLAIQALALNDEEVFLYPVVFYELQVFGTFPSTGSVLGGSQLIIYGTGFSSIQSDIEVVIGELPCEVKYTNSTHIQCITSAITKTVTVEVNVVDSTYVWDPEVLVIQVGDTIQWSWLGLTLDLFQVENDSTVYDGQGFRSDRITNGMFSYTFTQPGTYYYASNVDNFVQLRGSVIVEETTNSTFLISVKVNNYYSEYNVTNDLTINDPSTCQGDNKSFPEVVTFTYATCATPLVTSITPLSVTVQDVITISGQGFSATPEMNTITIGGNYTCSVIDSTETSISCLLDPSYVLPINKPLQVEVNVHSAGNALFASNITENKSVILLSTVIRVVPSIGSVQGGLNLSIVGSGFDNCTTVNVDGKECLIKYLDYFNIICTVQAYDGEIISDTYAAEIVVNTCEMQSICGLSHCVFNYSMLHTPVVVNVYPTSFYGDNPTSIILSFNNSLPPPPVYVMIGKHPCEITNTSNDTSSSSSITCTFNPIEAGSYNLKVVMSFGEAMFINSLVVTSEGGIISLTPNSGSVEGGTILTISGYGFSSQKSNNIVLIGSQPCHIVYSSYSNVQCITPPQETVDSNYTVAVVVNHVDFDINGAYYSYGDSPEVIAIDPSSGQIGDNVTITGSLFSNATSDNVVTIGSASCIVYAASASEINCTVGGALAGTHVVDVLVYNIGRATGLVIFEYIIRVSSLSPTEGSFAGKNILTIYGAGFEPATTFVKICSQLCKPTNNPPSLTTLQCVIPALTYNSSDVSCNVTVSSMNSNVVMYNAYTYMYSLTPQLTSLYPTIGGTAGGTTITIIGSGFISSNTTVSIGNRDNQCDISDINDTTIVCQTGAFGRTVKAEIFIIVNGNFAITSGLTFYYIDLWSSNFTWGEHSPPVDGDFVVVPRGQTVAIDVDTAILSFLLIQGGTVMFLDESNVSLHTQFVLITDNGTMQAGTEGEPFTHKLEIVLYGHSLSTELPVYGAKTLAVRNGTLDLHGMEVNVTWTKLAVTASPGDITITLQEPVPWEIGGKIVIVSTSYSLRENEEVEITGIDSTGTVLTIDPPLQYKHISVKQTIAGKYIDTSAEVGYLTRNIIVRGNRITEWDAPIPACPEEFRPGQFDVQTCFQGRFGAETASDKFGGQIILHAPVMNENTVTGRIEYVEVTHAGQVFRLGRHPLNFHRLGDLKGSYVKGCAFHDTFNGAIVVNGGNYLLIEGNVAYKVMGNAFVQTDGIGTIVQDNLAAGVTGSSSLLNVDISPAAFFTTHPDNILRRNVAAGSSHFGFWYYTENGLTSTSQSPRYTPLGEFSDNTIHSVGRYGLQICPGYFPKVDGNHNGPDQIAVFNRIISYNNRKGIVSCRTVGALQIHNSTFLDNQLAAVELRAVSGQWGELGPLIENVLIVGHSEVNSDDSNSCTASGFKAPCSYYLTVSNATFANFDRPQCSAISSRPYCGSGQRGFETRYSDITLINTPNLVTWRVSYEHIHKDLDGSLTGIVNGSLLPYNALLSPDNCSIYQTSNTYNTSLCDGSVNFARIHMHDVSPLSLHTTTIHLSNQFGTSDLPYETRGVSDPSGFTAVVTKGYEYFIEWENGDHISNKSYSMTVSGLYEDEYFWITHNYSQPVDKVVINGVEQNSSSTFPDPTIYSTGTWYAANDTTYAEGSGHDVGSTFDYTYAITYLVKGQPYGAQFTIHYVTFRCFYENCITPTPPPTLPPGTPNDTQNWSDNSTWDSGYLPQEGETVTITWSQYVIVDIALPRLYSITIYGGLELSDELNHTIEVDYIVIAGGRLVVGWPDMPFTNTATFILYGSRTLPEIILPPIGPVLGTKAIGVFGQLILHGQNRIVIWTHLAETALPGSDTIQVNDSPDWNVGDVIVIASTSFEMLHTEKFQILNISEGMITLNGTLQYKHLGEETNVDNNTYIQRAEVGLLTRNIIIQSGDVTTTDEESFGCRILVGSYTNEYGIRLVGSAQIDGVEIANCGQEGFPDPFDPRYSFAVLNTRIGATATTYIRRSSIHDGYNTGIGVFGSDGVIISDNVIHRTVGPSVVLEGLDHILTKTMTTVALFPGTYHGTDDTQNFQWTANFKLTRTINLTLIGNAAAGGAKVGFHVDGESCDSPVVNGTPRWEANVAHSTLHGIHVGYDDGLGSCLQLSFFTIYSCYHYGIFTYSTSAVFMENNVLIDNNAALLLNVYSPPALSHQTSNKNITIKNTIIVGASQNLTSEDDAIEPEVSSHSLSFSPILGPDGGHIGIILSSFLSRRGHFPTYSWPSITTYPAINGLTILEGVTFINFANRSSKRDFAFTSHPKSEDCQHPTYTSNVKLINVDHDSLYYNHMPNLGSVNPSDCVDLDCDGQKHILIKDLDGSLLGIGAGGTIISQAEFEWDGDPRRGLGDYRIPTVLLTDPNDGTPLSVDDLFPLKGIVRGGNRSENNCTWISSWNSYSCNGLNHLMFVFESLDEDTEVRRLSPFALAANGFIDILNGPKDHGWCGGYTCQERISTFYGIIAPGLNYEIALTSTNPQNMRFRLLNAEETDTIRIAFVYTNPQRLDVYYGDTYVNPTNVRMENGQIVYDSKDPNLPDDQFQPTINDQPGANFYERSDKHIYFILRGNIPISIYTSPVVQLALYLPPLTIDEFFEENLIFNLATLLGIDESRIKIVEVISEASSRKRETAAIIIYVQIGNPPMFNATNDTVTNQTSTYELEFETLDSITSLIAEFIQTGKLEELLNVVILFAEVQPPEPPSVDHTGGVHATNTTGGPQMGEVDNGTLTYEELLETLLLPEVTPVILTIPKALQIISQIAGGIEGLSLTPLLIVVIHDRNGDIVSNLGIGDPWVISISIISNSTSDAEILPSSEIVIAEGYVNLTNFYISHPGNGYILKFSITDPPVNFTTQTDPFDVAIRELVINIVQLPESGNTTLPLYPYPTIELLDNGNMQRVANLGWRGRRWFAHLQVQVNSGQTIMEWSTEFNSDDASATFEIVIINQSGDYLMEFSAYTSPHSEISVMESTQTITISELPSVIMSFILDADFPSVIGDDQESFIQLTTSQLSELLTQVTIYNLSVSQGSIIVTFNVQSEDTQDVLDAIDTFLDTDLSITYNGVTYDTHSRTAQFVSTDSDNTKETNDDNDAHKNVVIIASTMGGLFFLVFLIASLVVIGYRCYKKRSSKIWRIHVAACDTAHDTTKSREMQPMYWQAFEEENQYATEFFSYDGPKNQL